MARLVVSCFEVLMEKTDQDEAGQSVLRARGVVHRKAGFGAFAVLAISITS